jgi:hypothetical protein
MVSCSDLVRREIMGKLNRHASEGGLSFGTGQPAQAGLAQLGTRLREWGAKMMERNENALDSSAGFGRRGWTRTSDHLLRRQVLYPPELRAHSMSYRGFRCLFFAVFSRNFTRFYGIHHLAPSFGAEVRILLEHGCTHVTHDIKHGAIIRSRLAGLRAKRVSKIVLPDGVLRGRNIISNAGHRR